MRTMLGLALAGCLVLGMAPRATADEHPRTTTPAEGPPAATVDVDSLIASIKERIAGREQEPAEAVFAKIEILKGIPAGRVLPIMKFGFSRSLGVDCAHCHDVADFASEAKPQKQIAREMWKLAGDIRQQLAAIPDLESEQPVVNCTTCHRGQRIPATDLK